MTYLSRMLTGEITEPIRKIFTWSAVEYCNYRHIFVSATHFKRGYLDK